MINVSDLKDLMPLITEYLTTDDDIRFKTYATTQKDPEFFKILYGDSYEWYINKMKRDLTFNEYVNIFNTCDYSLYIQYKHNYVY
jgi:hypothetical protein